MRTRRRFRFTPLLGLVGLALTGGLVLPMIGYVAGKNVLGTYEGKQGFIDYLDSLYAAAARGEALAWWLLLTPALITLLWYLILRALRPSEAPDDD